MLKIKGTEIQQALTELMMQAAGPLAQPLRAGRRRDADSTRFTAALAPRYCNYPQDDDLRRLERDPAQHHRQACAGAVRTHAMNFDYTEEQQLLAASIARFVERDYDFDARSADRRVAPSGCSAAIWAHARRARACSACRLPADYGGFGGGARRR